MFSGEKVHSDWYIDGIKGNEQCWKLNFQVPRYDGWIKIQVFGNLAHQHALDIAGPFRAPRLIIERDTRSSGGDIRDYAGKYFYITDKEAENLLESDTDGAIGLMARKIIEVLALPRDQYQTGTFTEQ